MKSVFPSLTLTCLSATSGLARSCDDREVGLEARITLCDQAFAVAADPDAAASALGCKGEALRLLARLDEAAVAAAPLRAAVLAGAGDVEGSFHDALAQLDLARGDLEGAARHFTRAMALDPSLARICTRGLSELGFLPLSSTRHNVALALQRCLAAKGVECRIGG